MESIISKQGYNTKHVRRILFLPMDYVIAIPDADAVTGRVDISAVETAVDPDVDSAYPWFELTPVFSTAVYSEKENAVAGIPVWEVKLACVVAKENMNRFLNFEKMECNEFLMVVVDWNNFSHLCGSINIDGEKSGMRIRKVMATNPMNAYNVEFTMDSIKRPVPGLNVSLVVPALPPGWVPVDDTEEG